MIDELWELATDIVVDKYNKGEIIDDGDNKILFWGSVDIEYEKLLRSYKLKQLYDNIKK